MTISNLGAVASTQLSSLSRKPAKPDDTAATKTSGHHHKSKTGQPSLSDSLQALLMGQQSTPSQQQVVAKAQAAYGAQS